MNLAVLEKDHMAAFVAFLCAEQKVVGPTAAGYGQFRFAEVQALDQLCLHYRPTILPPKKYFLPPCETLLRYEPHFGQELQALAEVEELILFGVHTCDLAGIQCLNIVFAEQPRDLHYQIRQHHLTLIGLECNDYCDGFANCAMLHNHLPTGGYDLFFTELAEVYHAHAHTPRGEWLMQESTLFQPVSVAVGRELAELRGRKKRRFSPEVAIRYQDLPRLLSATWDSEVWQRLGQRCLACGNCTNVCPTCYCFDVVDGPALDATSGRRLRLWDSCQNQPFAQVAGGENFRAGREQRQRHRFQRKFNYPMERYGRLFCTGCGRCSRTCMAAIDLKQTLNELIEERG